MRFIHPRLNLLFAGRFRHISSINQTVTDLVKQFTRITGINCGNGLGTYNAIHRNTKQALRNLNSVRTGCPDPINYISATHCDLSHQPSICPSTWFSRFLSISVRFFNLSTVGLEYPFFRQYAS